MIVLAVVVGTVTVLGALAFTVGAMWNILVAGLDEDHWSENLGTTGFVFAIGGGIVLIVAGLIGEALGALS